MYLKPRMDIKHSADGAVHFNYTVDAEPVMEAMKAYGDIIQKHKRGAAGAKLIGSIDPITAEIWRRECGAGIGTKEYAAYAKKKLQSRDFSRFRVGGG